MASDNFSEGRASTRQALASSRRKEGPTSEVWFMRWFVGQRRGVGHRQGPLSLRGWHVQSSKGGAVRACAPDQVSPCFRPIIVDGRFYSPEAHIRHSCCDTRVWRGKLMTG